MKYSEVKAIINRARNYSYRYLVDMTFRSAYRMDVEYAENGNSEYYQQLEIIDRILNRVMIERSK